MRNKFYLVSFTCRRLSTRNMEGVLSKWTNYLSGWQPRWFILDNGVLSYYKSQEDVNNGCKGSIKMAVCDIVVHPTDMCRLDLIIPGEQHYYVRASTPQDRQSWLIALGSSKASFSETSAAKKEADAMPDQMRSKKSELRLYCDLLIQQVHSVKEISTQASTGQIDVEKLTEASSLIGATCDTFIATLDDCMKILASTPMFDAPHQHVRDAAIPSSPTRSNSQRLPGTRSTITRPVSSEKRSARGKRMSRGRQSSTGSVDSIKIHTSSSSHNQSITTNGSSSHKTRDIIPLSPALDVSHLSPNSLAANPPSSPSLSPTVKQNDKNVSNTPMPSETLPDTAIPQVALPPLSNGLKEDQHARGDAEVQGEGYKSPSQLSTAASSEDLGEDFKDAIDGNIGTFFSTMKADFSQVDITNEAGIVVKPFLDACANLVGIFDKLNSTAFAPVKMDFTGNIRKINQKHMSDPEKYFTLQIMVLDEVHCGQHTHSNSATSALLWLKRSLEFLQEFMKEFCSGSTDLSVCASNAYGRTLKNYHGWVVRGVFAVAVKALPYWEDFVLHLAGEDCIVDPRSRQFEHALLADTESYLVHLDKVLVQLRNFYIANGLDSTDTV